jgi:hypothetical protein
MNSEKYQIPKLTADNYVDWIVKMKSVLKAKELYQLVLGKELTKVRGEDGRIIEINQSLRLDKAHALIITRVHSSISSRVCKDGANECPIKLWKNILKFGASKKEANMFKAWYRLLHLPLQSDNVQDFIFKFWDGVAVLQSLDATVDQTILGHIILMKIPHGLSHVRNSIIASATTSTSKVTYKSVLKMLDSQVKDNASVAHKPTVTNHASQSDEAEVLLTCPQGRHLPNNKSHTADQFFSIHPKLLTEYRKRKKEKEAAKAHLTTLSSPSMFNVEADNPTQSAAMNELVALFNTLPANLDNHSDGHKSDASLL